MAMPAGVWRRFLGPMRRRPSHVAQTGGVLNSGDQSPSIPPCQIGTLPLLIQGQTGSVDRAGYYVWVGHGASGRRQDKGLQSEVVSGAAVATQRSSGDGDSSGGDGDGSSKGHSRKGRQRGDALPVPRPGSSLAKLTVLSAAFQSISSTCSNIITSQSVKLYTPYFSTTEYAIFS